MIEFEFIENNRSRCSFCGENILKGTYYLSAGYSSSFGRSRKNICVNCMLRGVVKNFKSKEKIINEIDLMIKKECINSIKEDE